MLQRPGTELRLQLAQVYPASPQLSCASTPFMTHPGRDASHWGPTPSSSMQPINLSELQWTCLCDNNPIATHAAATVATPCMYVFMHLLVCDTINLDSCDY